MPITILIKTIISGYRRQRAHLSRNEVPRSFGRSVGVEIIILRGLSLMIHAGALFLSRGAGKMKILGVISIKM
jgi:hypothetical protein